MFNYFLIFTWLFQFLFKSVRFFYLFCEKYVDVCFLDFLIQSESHFQTEQAKIESDGQRLDPLYFIKQTVGNACGYFVLMLCLISKYASIFLPCHFVCCFLFRTIGLIHAILNNAEAMNLAEDKFFGKFLRATKDQSPDERAISLEKNEDIE